MQAAVTVEHFTGSILVVRDGTAVMSKGYGMANYEWNIPNTPHTVFRLGSITKQFTGMAIMILQERGKLKVNDPICKYLDNCPAPWQSITIRHLLTHTSGIPNYTAFPDFAAKNAVQPYTSASLVETFRDKPLAFTPDEKFDYSNSGYHLLGLIIEKASGTTYANFLRDNIFVPLGMKQSGYDDTRTVVPQRASGYEWSENGYANAPYINMLIPYAAGSLYSTTEDLLLWDRALYTDKLVTHSTLKEIFAPFKNNYGYGWMIHQTPDGQMTEHAGGIFGFSTTIRRFPAKQVTVIVLGNNSSAQSSRIGSDLSAIVLGRPYRIPVERNAITLPAATLNKYVGRYRLAQIEPNLILTISNENGKLMGQPTGQPKAELFAESETNFFLKVADIQLTFIKDAQGKVTGVVVHQGGTHTTAPQIK
jgi:CubicO group peptidase (beta-lactamase class C family)